MEATTSYTYDPLPTKSSMRLVTVAKSDRLDADIQCSLETLHVDDHLDYVAVSYVWGAKKGTLPIICDGKVLLVTRNLLAALRNIRSTEKDRAFWIDAICINQEDLDERSNQTAMMRRIFQRARRVAIFLGEKYVPDSDFDFEWFSRSWIIQEAAVNKKDPLVMCGRDVMEWSVLTAKVERKKAYLKDYSALLTRSKREQLERIVALDTIRTRFRDKLLPLGQGGCINPQPGSKASNLLDLIRYCQFFGCSDPRDKIYSLLGLAFRDDDLEPGLAPDYHLRVAKVYGAYGRFIIKQECSLSFLHDVGTYRSLQGLPSWIPDWSISTNRGILPPECHLIPSPGSVRSFSSAVHPEANGSIHKVRGELLTAYGWTLDTINQHGQEYGEERGNVTFDHNYPKVRAHWESLVIDHCPQGDRLWSYLSTLTAGLLSKYQILWGDVPILLWCSRWATRALGSDLSMALYPDEGPEDEECVNRCMALINYVCCGRKLAVTLGGRLALVPRDAKEGDKIVFLFGGRSAFVLRPYGQPPPAFTYVGDCYLHGLTTSEVTARMERSGREERSSSREHFRIY